MNTMFKWSDDEVTKRGDGGFTKRSDGGVTKRSDAGSVAVYGVYGGR